MNRGARQRQLRYIGGLLSREDVEPIRIALHNVLRPTSEELRRFHETEQWRDRLMTGDEDDINAFIAYRPSAERRRLRELVRTANRERIEIGSSKSARLLFKYLRDC